MAGSLRVKFALYYLFLPFSKKNPGSLFQTQMAALCIWSEKKIPMLKITESKNSVKFLEQNRPSKFRHVSIKLTGSLLSQKEPKIILKEASWVRFMIALLLTG